ncbi:hypothetical protein E2C01_023021 [Portunus trituberculatus]|uniref:Uncharacterized protein n=1 Tax=Portunus trituberculatus TaxID=210409 RepID=A0A5B7E6Y0_PORTR|nr:hypothetical protein [Portunus trituberculatus]
MPPARRRRMGAPSPPLPVPRTGWWRQYLTSQHLDRLSTSTDTCIHALTSTVMVHYTPRSGFVHLLKSHVKTSAISSVVAYLAQRTPPSHHGVTRHTEQRDLGLGSASWEPHSPAAHPLTQPSKELPSRITSLR